MSEQKKDDEKRRIHEDVEISFNIPFPEPKQLDPFSNLSYYTAPRGKNNFAASQGNR